MRPSLAGKQNIQAKEVDFDTQLKQGEKTFKPCPKKHDSVKQAREKRKKSSVFDHKIPEQMFSIAHLYFLKFLTGLKRSKCPGKKKERKSEKKGTLRTLDMGMCSDSPTMTIP